jgi:hypothetical protein
MQTKNVQKNRKISKKVYVKKTFSLTPPIKESKNQTRKLWNFCEQHTHILRLKIKNQHFEKNVRKKVLAQTNQKRQLKSEKIATHKTSACRPEKILKK